LGEISKKTPGTKFSAILNLLLFEQNFSLGREWSKETSSEKYANMVKFSTDTTGIGPDNQCRACISDNKEHFEGPLIPGKNMIKGFYRSRSTIRLSGMIRRKRVDNHGLEHTFDIPGSFYALDSKCRMLNPKQWAKTQKKQTRMQE
jgi:hypothetical protein